ncbi:hypothetical protein AG0111_0g2621 [Alternaria gaisen]|uniref:Uncharacterized protein n=1 Tax=Alternaria gaisen TaxID=167740 RepID=A0ACB6FXR9_9PLEO|nr:hypothetical protein AG0111_0g2621 [Alternaria gaisen]
MPPRQSSPSKPRTPATKLLATLEALRVQEQESGIEPNLDMAYTQPFGPSFAKYYRLPAPPPAPPTARPSRCSALPARVPAKYMRRPRPLPDNRDVEMADAGSVSPTGDLSQSEAPSATAPPAHSPPSMSAADSPPSGASASRASSILQDTEMTTEDALVASQILEDDELAGLDETNSAAHASRNAFESASQSETDSENGSIVVDKTPRSRQVPGPSGDIETPLWVGPERHSVMSLLTKFIVDTRDEEITLNWLERLRANIEQLCHDGFVPGPVLVRSALGTFNNISASTRVLIPPVDVSDSQSTVENFFSLLNRRNRNIFEPRVAALLHHHLNGAITLDLHPEHADEYDDGMDLMCGNCARGLSRPFNTCRLAVIDDLLFLRGTCTNCYAMGYEASCSCTRESKMYGPVKPPATVAPAPTSPPPSVVPPRFRAARPSALILNPPNVLRSHHKDSIAWGKLGPEEMESGDTEFNPKKRFQPLDIGDPKKGFTKSQRAELLKLIKEAEKEVLNAPDRSPQKSPKTPSPRKKAAPRKKQTPSPRKRVSSAERSVSPVTFGRSDRPSARGSSPPRPGHLSYIPPAASDRLSVSDNQDGSESDAFRPDAVEDESEDKPSPPKKPRVRR